VQHGGYSLVYHRQIGDLYERHLRDPDPLNMLRELALAKALLEDWINRFGEWRDALFAWHAADCAALAPDRIAALRALLDDHEALLAEQLELASAEEARFRAVRETLDAFSQPSAGKPRMMMDIADGGRLVDLVTRIGKRIEDIGRDKAVSRPTFFRVLTEMGRIVELYNDEPDPAKRLERIRDGWARIRLA
jgi:hypothetical protein